MTAMKVARRTFTCTDMDGSRGEVVAGERIVADHALVRDFPAEFRDFGLDDELAVRSAWVAEMRRDEAERHSPREPLSRAGREERKQDDFWRSTEALLERTRDDQPTSEQRAEQAFFDRAVAQLEESDTRELAEVNADAERAYGFDRDSWSRRVAD